MSQSDNQSVDTRSTVTRSSTVRSSIARSSTARSSIRSSVRSSTGSQKLDRHQSTVDVIQHRIKTFYDRKESFSSYHGSENATSAATDPAKIVDTSALNSIIRIDPSRRVALVEPNVPMDAFVQATLPYSLVPPVVPEFPGITVGGSFSGTAGESSSFKHGFFDRSVNWVEIVLANGSLVRASPDENPDLFYGAAGAFGTLGVATLFEIRLEPTCGFVEVTYLPVSSAGEAVDLLRKCSTDDLFDYIDGILFSASRGVIVLGRTTENRNQFPIQRFTRAHDPWFYLHAEACARKTASRISRPSNNLRRPSVLTVASDESITELVPLYDYLFRYDRGAFWMGSRAFDMFSTPFNRLTRFALDPLMRTRKMYDALHSSGHAQRMIIQDLALPAETAEAFVDYIDREFCIYPLWLCPMRADSRVPMHAWPRGTEMLINVGVWGPGRGYGERDTERFLADNRAIEHKVRDLGGLKWLYAQTYATEREFWGIYNRGEYEVLRCKYSAQTLPDLYYKVKATLEEKKPAEKKGGVLKGLLGRKK